MNVLFNLLLFQNFIVKHEYLKRGKKCPIWNTMKKYFLPTLSVFCVSLGSNNWNKVLIQLWNNCKWKESLWLVRQKNNFFKKYSTLSFFHSFILLLRLLLFSSVEAKIQTIRHNLDWSLILNLVYTPPPTHHPSFFYVLS